MAPWGKGKGYRRGRGFLGFYDPRFDDISEQTLELLQKLPYERLTLPRVVILDFLVRHRDKHYTVKEIYKYFLKKGVHIGIASLYRNLDWLVALGVVSKHIIQGEAYYQIIMENEVESSVVKHLHVIKNNKMEDLEVNKDLKFLFEDFVSALVSYIKNKYKIKDEKMIIDVSVEIKETEDYNE